MLRLFTSKMNKGLVATLLSMTLVLCTTLTALAGDGSGGGTGGGSTPVTFVGAYMSTIANNASTTGSSVDGSTKVPVKPTIKLEFSNNVVNDAVWTNNIAAVTMKDADGNSIGIQVDRISDLVNPNEKQNIFVTPLTELTLGKSYTIAVNATLQAKNVTTLGQIQNISFTVKSDITPPALAVTSLNNNDQTNKNLVKVSGTTEVGAIVYVNDKIATPDSLGAFTATVNLKAGKNTITITSTDAFNNTTTLTNNVYYDNVAPLLKIKSPGNNYKTKNKSVTITGTTEKGCIVKVNGKVVANKNGNFNAVVTLKKGINTIVISSTDAVGNIRTVTIKVNKLK